MEEQPVSEEHEEDGALPAQDSPAGGRRKTTRRKLIIWMSTALVALLLIAGLMGGLYAWRFLTVSSGLTIDDVDMSRIPDGTYKGSYDVFHVKAAVEVRVEAGRVVAIDFTDTGRMAEETQQEIREIFDEVISSQSLQVDVTSGASTSKKVSLKAVEEALGGE